MAGLADFLNFNNPEFVGLLQGLGQASMPSRMPVPFGAVMGDALDGYLRGHQLNQQRQLLQPILGAVGAQNGATALAADNARRNAISDSLHASAAAAGVNLPQTPPLPTAGTGQQPVNSRTIARQLLAAAAGGVPPETINAIRQAAERLDPNIQFDRGFGYDAHDATQAGQYHPLLTNGEAPALDAEGRVTGVQNIPGALESATARSLATPPADYQMGADGTLVPRPGGPADPRTIS